MAFINYYLYSANVPESVQLLHALSPTFGDNLSAVCADDPEFIQRCAAGGLQDTLVPPAIISINLSTQQKVVYAGELLQDWLDKYHTFVDMNAQESNVKDQAYRSHQNMQTEARHLEETKKAFSGADRATPPRHKSGGIKQKINVQQTLAKYEAERVSDESHSVSRGSASAQPGSRQPTAQQTRQVPRPGGNINLTSQARPSQQVKKSVTHQMMDSSLVFADHAQDDDAKEGHS